MRPARGAGRGIQSGARSGAQSAARGRGRGVAPTLDALGAQALARALCFEAPADTVLRSFFREHPALGRRDRGEIAEAVFDVIRNRRLYAHLAQSATGPLEQRLLALSQARRAGRLDIPALPFAVRYSLPDWLAEALLAGHGAARAEVLAAALLEGAPLDLRVNTLKSNVAAVLAALCADGIEAQALPQAPNALRVTGKPALERSAAFVAGWCEVQDVGSQLLALLVAPRRGQIVVDLCAGAGGKTLALAAAMRSSGQVYACDVSAPRLLRMRRRLERCGATNVQPMALADEHDARLHRLHGRADAVLVDAPCTGTGTLRRNPDLKWRNGPAEVARLAATQRAIVAAGAAAGASGRLPGLRDLQPAGAGERRAGGVVRGRAPGLGAPTCRRSAAGAGRAAGAASERRRPAAAAPRSRRLRRILRGALGAPEAPGSAARAADRRVESDCPPRRSLPCRISYLLTPARSALPRDERASR